mmetsp:Transcript_33800/g.68992  ORF Transcript_33800/g.68992 Transcript_33800/m.68992 type:complete len:89 (+) Transcript_33800:2081-2347(+)
MVAIKSRANTDKFNARVGAESHPAPEGAMAAPLVEASAESLRRGEYGSERAASDVEERIRGTLYRLLFAARLNRDAAAATPSLAALHL